jgi:hypothetical protein
MDGTANNHLNGNLLLGTTTDAGFRLDVNGTARVQTSAYFATTSGAVGIGTTSVGGSSLLDISNANGSAITRIISNLITASGAASPFSIIEFRTPPATNGTVGLNSGRIVSGFDNTVYGGSRVTIQNATGANTFVDVLSVYDSNVGIGTNAPTFKLDVNGTFRQSGSTTAASAIARGSFISPTLVAAANSDVLVGLDINPTFTNGAFTGVSNIGLRVLNTGTTQLQIGNVGTGQFFNIGRNGSNGYLTIDGGANGNGYIFSKSTTNYAIIDGTGINIGTGAAPFAAISTTLKIAYQGLNSVFAANPATDSYIVLRNTNDGKKIAFGHDGTGAMNFYSEATNTSFTSSNIVGKYFATGNWFIGSSPTDAGFRLDVNGTARVTGNLTVGGGSGILITTSGAGLTASGASTAITSYAASGAGVGYTFTLNNVYGNISTSRTLFQIAEPTYSVVNQSANNGSVFWLTIAPNINATGGTLISRGIYYNPTLTATTGLTHIAFQNTTGNVLLGTTSGSVGIGANTSINASAILDITSTTKGFLPPRMTLAQRTAIGTPATGLIVYQTDGVEGLWLNTSTGWRELTVV